MNLEKLKEHECRFCKHYADEICCDLPDEACAFQWFNDQSRPKDKPILWDIHPDIAEAMPETTDKDYDIDFSGHYKCRLHVHENKITIEAAVTGWGDPVSIDDIDVIEFAPPAGGE